MTDVTAVRHAPYIGRPALRWLAIAVVALVALAPLPFGGNRPVLWGLWTFLASLLLLGYGGALLARNWPLALPLASYRLPAIMFAIVCAWLAVQVLPIAGLFGLAEIPLPSGGTLHSDAVSVDTGSTLLMLTRWVGYGMVFFLSAQIGTSRSLANGALHYLQLAIVGYAVLGLLFLLVLGDTYFGLPKEAYRGFATSTFVNRNSFATFLAFGLAIGSALLLGPMTGPAKGRAPVDPVSIGLHLCGLAIILAALVATGSRMGLFAGVCGALMVLFLALGNRLARGRLLLVLLVVGLGLAGTLLLFGGAIVARVESLGEDAGSRLEFYRQIVAMIGARPLTGLGGGSFELAFQLYHHLPLSGDVIWARGHSTYLTLFAELGVVVGGLVLLLVATLSGIGVRGLRNGKVGRRIPLAIAGMMVVAVLHSTVDFSLEIQANAYLFIAVLGLGYGYSRHWPAPARLSGAA